MSTEALLLRERILDCEGCALVKGCSAPVPFFGDAPNDIAVLGEAPGQQEDLKGQPFIGPAGQLARKHLREVGLDPEKLTWFNTVSCNPNGTPTAAHVQACSSNREAQRALIDPTWLLVFGRVALQALRPELDIKRGRGRPFVYKGSIAFAAYHPSFALRNRLMEEPFREDLEKFAKMVAGGKDHWWEHVSDRCVACLDYVESFDETGIGRCARHGQKKPEVHRAAPREPSRPQTVENVALFG